MTQEELQELKALALAAASKNIPAESQGIRLNNLRWAATPEKILALIERIESLTADAERLEMVTRDNSKITELRHGVWAFEYRESMRMSATHGGTPRGAIDAAIAEGKAKS